MPAPHSGLGRTGAPAFIMGEWRDHNRYPHDGNLCDQNKKNKYFFLSFPLGHSLADKFSAVTVSARYCEFAGFIFTYVTFPYSLFHSHSSFGR